MAKSDYYARNRERHKRVVKAWQERTRTAVQKLLADFRAAGCCLCGEQDPACLEAHHRDPSQKELRIWEWRHGGVAAAKVEAELDKCICVCSNCHRKLHRGQNAEERAPRIGYKRRWLLNKRARERLLNSNGITPTLVSKSQRRSPNSQLISGEEGSPFSSG